MENRFKITTVQDMVDCTNEANLKNFLTDLEAFLTTANAIKAMCELVGETEEQKKVGSDGFTWIDDGKHDAKITLGRK